MKGEKGSREGNTKGKIQIGNNDTILFGSYERLEITWGWGNPKLRRKMLREECKFHKQGFKKHIRYRETWF